MKQFCKFFVLFSFLLLVFPKHSVYAEESVAGFDTAKFAEIEKQKEQILKGNMIESEFTNEERVILERITEAEAESEGLIGKILVVNVIMNRLKDEKFEDSIHDVVFAKDQFQPTRDGRYKKIKVTDETKFAVSLVIDYGFYISDKILFFHSTKSKEFSNYTKLFTYKGHVFYTY